MSKPFDVVVRLALYRFMIDLQRAPSASELAAHLERPVTKITAALESLAAQHMIVLRPGGSEVAMIPPFAAERTRYALTDQRHTWYANCAWDAFGIPFVLQRPVEIHTDCPDCGEQLKITAEPESVPAATGIVHWAVPAREWWTDIFYT